MDSQIHPNQLYDEIQPLASFLHELNITRRHLLTYPQGHPMIDSAIEKVVAKLDPLFSVYDQIQLGVAQNSLLFKELWIGKDQPSIRDFANALAQLDIASLHFRGQPDKSELLKLADLMNFDRQSIHSKGGLTAAIEQLNLRQIVITPIDFAVFQATELDPEEQEQLAESLWQDFIGGLLAQAHPTDFTPRQLAEALNKQYEASGSSAACEQAIADFIQQMARLGDYKQKPGKLFFELIEHLNPELRRQFLDSTFRHLANSPEFAEDALKSLMPTTVLELAMLEINQEQLQISSAMLNLLGTLSSHHNSPGQLTSGQFDGFADVGEKLKVIFREEDKGKFTPESYRSTLDTIILPETDFLLSGQETENLRQQIINSSTERHNCAIIFNLLENEELHSEHCEVMQTNLIDLGRFFLETGDFKSLAFLHQRLRHFLQQHRRFGAERTAKLQKELNTPEFQQEVLNNLSRWDEKKQQEIKKYIQIAGASISTSLIERLAAEEDKSLRRLYLTSLASLGKAAHPAIYKALNDERWYLVRNLLAALRMQDDPIDADKFAHLEKHPHLRINQELLQLLFKFDRERANRLLSKQLESDDPKLSLHAVQLAELSSDPAIAQILLKLLTAERLTDDNLPFKQKIIRSLNGIGAEEAMPELENLLQPGLLYTSSCKLELQKEIIRNLGNYPPQTTGPLLQKLIRSRRKEISKLAAEKLRQVLRK